MDLDYSNLGSFSKRSKKANGKDSNSTGSAPATSGSFRGRARNARKLETLLEVEEEVSDGHASNKSSTEDLTQGPGPPRMSRVTALKSRFEAEGASEGGKSWRSHDRDSRGNKEVISSLKLRASPEGVERPVSPTPEMFDLDEERGKRDYSIHEFLDTSSLKINPSGQDRVENTEFKTRNSPAQESALEAPHSLEVKHILGELDLKSEVPSYSRESSTPSDVGDDSGASSPSSLSSTSSVSSNSASPNRSAVFAITGVAKKTSSLPRLSEPTQHQNAERATKAVPSPQGIQTELKTNESPRARAGLKLDLKQPSLQGLKTTQYQSVFQRVSNTKDLRPLTAKPEERSGDVLANKERTEDIPSQARMVKSVASPTKNENVGSIVRPTVLDLSRTGTKTKRFDGTSMGQNEATIGQKIPGLTEVKALDFKSDQVSATNAKASDVSSVSVRDQAFNSPELKTADSSVKTGKLQLSRLRYSPTPSLNFATLQQNAIKTSESATGLSRKVEDSLPNNNKKIPVEDTKKVVDSPLETNKRSLTNAPSPRFPQNLNEANDLKPSLGLQNSNESQDKSEHGADITDGTDNAKSLPDEQSSGPVNVDRPQIPLPQTFKPISFRAKKLAAEQSNKNASDNRSQLAPPISNSISIRGQSSSLTRITVTPAASYYSAKNSVNIPEKRSPVPTSKRQRFVHRGVAPTYPEVKKSLAKDESNGDSLLDVNEQKLDDFIDKEESSEKESTLADREQGNKPRKTPRSDGKQVVSSFNIQLSSQNRKQIPEQKHISPSSELRKGSSLSEGKQFNSESGRLISEGDLLNSEIGRLNFVTGSKKSLESSPTISFSKVENSSNVNNENIAGDDLRKQLEQPSKDVFMSSLLKPLSPSKQILSPQKTEETFQSKEVVTMKDFPLKVSDADTGIPVTVNGDIGLTGQSHNPVSDQLPGAVKDFSVMTKVDDKANPVFVNGDIGLLNKSHKDFSKENTALEESTEVALAPAQNNRKKKARHVSLDPHAVLLDAAVEGELDLVKHVIREVRNESP